MKKITFDSRGLFAVKTIDKILLGIILIFLFLIVLRWWYR